MPYTIDNAPEAIKGLPKHAKEIFIAAYNSAYEQYKGDEAKISATAWAAVKSKYEKKDDKWVAKESKMKESMSDNDKRNLLQAALTDLIHPIQAGMNPWISDVWEDKFVYCFNDKTYECEYTLVDEKVTLKVPKEVTRTTVYTPVESLRQKQSEIVQEIGRRNASADSARIKKIFELCQELLSGELEDETKTKEAIKEADSVLAWLKEQAITKTEDGVKYPAEAFAYVPDHENTSAWKLRLWEGGNVTKAQLGRAAAALSPGGFRGQKVQIPAGGLAEAKRRIRSEYRKLEVADDDMPRWVQESTDRTLLTGYIPLTEASINKGIAEITVIKPGFNYSKERYYPAEVLTRDYKVFEGLKMYADHPTDEDEKNRPERSIKDWVAILKNVNVTERGEIKGKAYIVKDWLNDMLASLKDRGMLSEMGVSINAVGTAIKGEIDGVKTNILERIVRGRSVDFVTEAGAGGLVEMYEAERDSDVDFISLEILRERRPDLVKQLESVVKAEILPEVKKKLEIEEQVKTLETNLETVTKERDGLKIKVTESEKAQKVAEAKVKIDEAIGKSGLPEPSRARLVERFKGAESPDGIEAAITAEVEYVKVLTESGKVRNLGPKKETEADHKALIESIKLMHPEYTDAQVETFISAR